MHSSDVVALLPLLCRSMLNQKSDEANKAQRRQDKEAKKWVVK